MISQEIKFNDKINSYSIFIGENIIVNLQKKIKKICPKTKRILLIVDTNIPNKFTGILKKKLKNYDLFFFYFLPSEKKKSIQTVNFFLEKLLSKNFTRSDLIISVGGGITGDLAGFIASIYKRGINFINVPTTLLAQVDSAVGGKTGVNTAYGKNLIGSFYQPKLVMIDTIFLSSLPRREMICGYAEILKHSIIKDTNFFNWLRKNSRNIFSKKPIELIYAIKKSCLIKMFYVNKDVHEKNLRMTLNFGHTIAHAIETKNNYSKRITHGEAVLAGIILETKLSIIKKVCRLETLRKIQEIYNKNNLDFAYKKFSKLKTLTDLIPFIKNDKKNDDKKINFMLLKKIGRTTKPNSQKISIFQLKKFFKLFNQY